MKRKRDIDRLIAEETGLRPRKVSEVTAAWIEIVRNTLVYEGQVHIDVLGTLTLHVNKGGKVRLYSGNFQRGFRGEPRLVDVPIRTQIRFRKAHKLTEQIKKHYVPPGDQEDVGQEQGRGHGQVRGRRERRQ